MSISDSEPVNVTAKERAHPAIHRLSRAAILLAQQQLSAAEAPKGTAAARPQSNDATLTPQPDGSEVVHD